MTDGESLLDSYDKQDPVEESVKAAVLTIAGGFPGFSILVDGVDRARQIIAQQRFDAYFRRVVEIVQVLAHRQGIPVEEIAGDGAFYNAMIATGMEYQRSGDERKLEALVAALSHTGSWSADTELVQRTVVGLVERLEPEHLIALDLMRRPRETAAALGFPVTSTTSIGELLHVVVGTEGNLGGELVKRTLKDLLDFGILDSGYGGGYMPFNGGSTVPPPITKELGLKLIEYLSH